MAYNKNGNGPELEKVNVNITTLTRFLTEEQVKHPEATGDFTYVSSSSHAASMSF
jgi:fructose-1,6-bisphosphatase I